jgi:cation diffusion facilitator CzcD-associated flavoprotein CzcO
VQSLRERDCGWWHLVLELLPGARVDSDSPMYQLFDKELREDYTFTEKYPAWQELQEYFHYVEKKYDTAKNVVYNKSVDNDIFDQERKQWLVECSDGSKVYTR